MEDDNFGFLDESHSYKVDFVINLNISWIPIKSPWNMKLSTKSGKVLKLVSTTQINSIM